MKKSEKTETGLLDFCGKATSPFHTVIEAVDMLKKAGFEEVAFDKEWKLNAGGQYYMTYHDSCLIAFTVGTDYGFRNDFRIAMAHGDFPGFCVKQSPEMQENGYLKLNTEKYGGAILNTWLDRPLSIAGRVALKSESVFEPEMRFVDFRTPLLTIPNLAIHMNRDVNKGMELNPQIDMMPVMGMAGEKKQKKAFMEYLADKLEIKSSEILDYELYLYNAEMGCRIGMKEELLSSPRLDNLTSVYALLKGILKGRREKGINMIAVFDHEEVGSKSKQGAASVLLSCVMEKIMNSFGRGRESFMETFTESMILSVDVAHAHHPNQPGKGDPTNKVILNKGICIKEAAMLSYATDSKGAAIVQQICEKEHIPYQKFANRSDITGGSTLGAIASTQMPISTVDIGVPILAMHSARELMGRQDQEYLEQLMKSFFSIS